MQNYNRMMPCDLCGIFKAFWR